MRKRICMWDNRGMEQPHSKLSEAGREVAKHTAWHFTGAPLLDMVSERWKRWVGAALPSIGAWLLGHRTGLNWEWATTVALLTAAVVWFAWHYVRWRNQIAAIVPQPAPAPSESREITGLAHNPTQPDLRVSYEESRSSNRGKLVLKTSSSKPIKIAKIGPLVSEELYHTENDLVLLKTVYPDIEANAPLECQVLGVNDPKRHLSTSLESVLEAGGIASDSVVIDYTSEGGTFSKKFNLHKNPDGTIVCDTQQSQGAPRDLSDLRHRMSLLKSAPEQLPFVGELTMLVKEANAVRQRLSNLMSEAMNVSDKAAIEAVTYPLSLTLFRAKKDSDPWEWYLKSLWQFHALYTEHRIRAFTYSLPFESGFLKTIVPSEMHFNNVISMLEEHTQGLDTWIDNIKRPYAASVIFAPFESATTS
jgi:hypothetical protein